MAFGSDANLLNQDRDAATRGFAASKTGRYYLLDGLRGVAAAAVLLHHIATPFAANALSHAPLAVDFFFCLSGFVIAHAYEARLSSEMTPLAFLKVRLVRLYPLIVLGTAIGAMVLFAKSTQGGGSSIGDFILTVGLTLLLVPSHLIGGVGNGAAFPLNTPAWSLTVEVVANGVYAATLPWLSGWRLWIPVILGALLLITMEGVPGWASGSETWAQMYRGYGRVVYSIYMGVMIARLRSGRKIYERPVLALTLCAILAGLLFSPTINREDLFRIFCVIVAFPTLIWIGSGVEFARARSIMALAGDMSYPVYILHFPVVRAFANFYRTHAVTGANLAGLVCLEIATITAVSYMAISIYDPVARRALRKLISKVAPDGRA